MNAKEFQAEYERIEKAAQNKLMTWEVALARVAMLAISYGTWVANAANVPKLEQPK